MPSFLFSQGFFRGKKKGEIKTIDKHALFVLLREKIFGWHLILQEHLLPLHVRVK
jgi:hypothetical protein